MNRSSFRHAFVAAVLIVAAALGCQKPASNPTVPAAPVTSAQPTPEESFATIVETFRRSVEDVPIGFIVQDGSGSQTMMTGRNTVTHELIPPAKEGDPFKAVIKVNSESRYSLQRSTGEPNVEDKQASENASADSSDAGSDVQIFDPAVVSAPGASGAAPRATTPKADKKVVTLAPPVENKHERAYELVHENGRWKLVTKLDTKTEESIQFAFDRALESQS